MIVEAHRGDRLIGSRGIGSVQRAEISHVVDDSQIVVNGRILRDVSDAIAQFGRAGRPSQHRHGSAGDDLRADNTAHQRGLAAPGRPEQPGDGAAGDLDGDIVHRDTFAAHHPQILHVDRHVHAIAK
jgi:hypothetical protein